MASVDVASIIAPTNIGAVPRLLSEVASAGHAFAKSGDDSFVTRRLLLAKTRELTRALETPRDIMVKHLWLQPCDVMAISFGVQSGLWTAMANNGDGPQKVADLAKQLGVEEKLLQRMMRHISASGYIDMTASDEYIPNSFSKSLALIYMGGSYHSIPLIFSGPFLHASEWLKDRGYKCPTDSLDTVFQSAHNTKLNFFGFLQANTPHGQNFSHHMHGYFLGRPRWMDDGFYPVKERLFDGFDTTNKDAVLLVDIAGGTGHYTEGFLSKFPDAPGRLILQDLPSVLEHIHQLHPHIEKIAYDFFTGQPVKGARAYYMHFVLHDWPDQEALKIARRVKEAMKPGYSKFLIHEHVVPLMGPDDEQTALDLIMMTSFGAKERSAAQWSELLEEKCGLKIVKIWTPTNGIESIVECEVPE